MIQYYSADQFSKNKSREQITVIFGGTFDPIHEGHIYDLKFLINNSKEVLIAPTSQNPWKSHNPTSLEIRIEMIKLVLDFENIEYNDEISPINKKVTILKRPYTFSIDLLRELQLAHNNLCWAIGEDLKESALKWKDWEQANTPLIVLPLFKGVSATFIREGKVKAHPALIKFIEEKKLYDEKD